MGLPYACDEPGDPTPRDELTERLTLALRVTLVGKASRSKPFLVTVLLAVTVFSGSG